jgi:ABC-2 type transport system ATP-binding protein
MPIFMVLVRSKFSSSAGSTNPGGPRFLAAAGPSGSRKFGPKGGVVSIVEPNAPYSLAASRVEHPVALRVVSCATLELRGVTKRWRRNRPPVLDGVDLALEPGTAVRISGRNGAGKTTLLRIAAGLIGADRGEVSVAGLRPDRDRREYQRHIGLLSAGSSGLYARLSVRRHLELWARLAMLPRAERAPAAERALDEFMLDDLASSRVDRISMGQRQRVRLAMTFMHDPLVALLDEPANSLDDVGGEVLASAVEKLRARGGAALWCCPSGEGQRFDFDRAYVVEDGALRPT